MVAKYSIEALPRDSSNLEYITDEMLADDPNLVDFLKRTRNSWYRDELRCRHARPVSIGRQALREG